MIVSSRRPPGRRRDLGDHGRLRSSRRREPRPATAGTKSAPSAAATTARRRLGRVRARRSSIALDIGRRAPGLRALGPTGPTVRRLRASREHVAAVLGDHDEVLDPRPAAPGHVDPGSTVTTLPGLQPRLGGPCQPRRLVRDEPDAVPEPVPEVLAMAGGGDEIARDRVDLAPRRARAARRPARSPARAARARGARRARRRPRPSPRCACSPSSSRRAPRRCRA